MYVWSQTLGVLVATVSLDPPVGLTLPEAQVPEGPCGLCAALSSAGGAGAFGGGPAGQAQGPWSRVTCADRVRLELRSLSLGAEARGPRPLPEPHTLLLAE